MPAWTWCCSCCTSLVDLNAYDSITCSAQVKTALESVLLPRTKEIEQELQVMQQEAQSVGLKSQEEHAEVQGELARMAQLVTDFQVRTLHDSQTMSLKQYA